MQTHETSGGTHTSARTHIAQAVAALGLLTAWNAASATEATATTTIHVEGGVSLFTDGGSLTLDLPAVGGVVAPFGAGNGTTLPITFNTAPQIPADGFYSFLGTIENADGSSDLVMSFPGDGSVASGVVWTSLFVDNIPEEERVFEPQVLAQLASPPVFDQGNRVEPGSQIWRLDQYYRDLTNVRYGETSTLVAFNGPGNTGVVIGTINITPAPGAAGLLMASGLALGTRRRRG